MPAYFIAIASAAIGSIVYPGPSQILSEKRRQMLRTSDQPSLHQQLLASKGAVSLPHVVPGS